MKVSSKMIISGFAVVLVVLAIWWWLAITGKASPGVEVPWGGVDVNVVERIAAEAGREAHEPLINTDQGDLLLFVFTLGGAVGGFVAGYCWRKLFAERVHK